MYRFNNRKDSPLIAMEETVGKKGVKQGAGCFEETAQAILPENVTLEQMKGFGGCVLWYIRFLLASILTVMGHIVSFHVSVDYRNNVFPTVEGPITKEIIRVYNMVCTVLSHVTWPILASGLAFLVEMKPFEEGLDQWFVYGVLPVYQIAATVIPMVGTVRYIFRCIFGPQHVPSLLPHCLLCIGSAFIFFLACDMILPEPRFLLGRYLCSFALPFSDCIAYYITAIWVKRQPIRKHDEVINLLFSYTCAMLLGAAWSWFVIWCQDKPSVWQTLAILLYALLHFIWKGIVTPKCTTAIAPEHFMHLNWVVDIIFTQRQLATLPFIKSGVAFGLIMLGQIVVAVNRIYPFTGRILYILRYLKNKNKEDSRIRAILEKLCPHGHVVWPILRARINQFHELSVLTQDNEAIHTRWGGDRTLWNHLDMIGVMLVSNLVRINQLLTMLAVRYSSVQDHIDDWLHVNDTIWTNSVIFTLALIGVNFVLMVFVAVYLVPKAVAKSRMDISMYKILYFVMNEEFELLFCWMVGSGAMAFGSMVNQFAENVQIRG
ncbi:expressed unknown protein [Seminavis robusta]|uniref:Uncharacterized protein n=1 Tax=Seminavis robusta TaxID=568900 RepID=A0A9N8H2J4_9STRA|nr:expressed unknown protein [Seminavis robusta]|eukprot:Sro37_g023470.1 n/a (546) ;mRNA; f:144548-146185